MLKTLAFDSIAYRKLAVPRNMAISGKQLFVKMSCEEFVEAKMHDLARRDGNSSTV